MTDLRAIGPFPSWQVVAPVDSDLVSVPVAPPAAGSHTLANHGGPSIATPKLVNLYPPGGAWFDVGKYERFCTELMANGYLTGLAAYGSGNGTFAGSFNVPMVLTSPIKASDLHAAALAAIAGTRTMPQPDGNTLYSILLPPGVAVDWDDGSGASCKNFCGYHTEVSGVPLIVLPATDCGGCNQGDPFVGLAMVTAHEVAESVTDPTGQTWYEDSTGMENADIVAWIQLPYGPWTVQGYWTNEHGNTVGPYTPVQQPKPPPPVWQPDPRTLAFYDWADRAMSWCHTAYSAAHSSADAAAVAREAAVISQQLGAWLPHLAVSAAPPIGALPTVPREGETR